MKNSGRNSITSRQLIFIIVGSIMGSGVLSLPRIVAKKVGQDAWMAIILGSVVPIISLSLIRYLYRRNSADSFVNICRKVSGRTLGSLFSGILAIYSIIATAAFLRFFVEEISIFLLAETPMLVKSVLMLALCAYFAYGDARVLGRVNEFLFYILLPLFLFPIPAVIANSDYRNLMPVLNYKVMDYVRAVLITSYSFSGFELYMVFHPYVSREKESFGASLYGILIVIAIYLYAVIASILVFGSELTKTITWPFLRLLSTAEIPILERVEFLFIQAWIAVSFRPISAQYYCASHIIAELMGLKSHKWITLALFPIIIGIASFPSNIFQVFKFSDYVGLLAIAVGIALPLILIVLGLFTQKRMAK